MNLFVCRDVRRSFSNFVNVAQDDGGIVSILCDDVKMIKGATKQAFEKATDSKGVFKLRRKRERIVINTQTGLVVRLNANKNSTNLRVMMLTNNFTWAPRYKMNLIQQNALITAQACIINDSVALREVMLCFYFFFVRVLFFFI